MAKFKVGDRVKFKNDPEARGLIVEVDALNSPPMYRVKLGVGSEWAEEKELKITKKAE